MYKSFRENLKEKKEVNTYTLFAERKMQWWKQ